MIHNFFDVVSALQLFYNLNEVIRLIAKTQADLNAAINRKSLNNRLLSRKLKLFYMALPFFALLILFYYLPLYGWIYSFFDSLPGTPVKEMNFIGLKFFERMFTPGSTFGYSLRNTLVMSFLQLITAPLPVIFALFLSEMKNKKSSKLIQTVTSLPNFISWPLVYAIFFTFFNSQGVVNSLLMSLNLISEPLNILANENNVWYVQTLVITWKTIGWYAIIYIASLSGIDGSLYDAADVDGAGRFGKMWHVSVPGIMPTFVVLMLLSVGNLLNSGFEQYWVFRNPVISQKIDVLDIYIYNQGLVNMEIGYATAVGMARSLVSIFLLFLVNYTARKANGQSIL